MRRPNVTFVPRDRLERAPWNRIGVPSRYAEGFAARIERGGIDRPEIQARAGPPLLSLGGHAAFRGLDRELLRAPAARHEGYGAVPGAAGIHQLTAVDPIVILFIAVDLIVILFIAAGAVAGVRATATPPGAAIAPRPW